MQSHMMLSTAAALIAALLCQARPAPAAPAEADKPYLASPPQEIVDDAMTRGLARFSRRLKGGGHTNSAWSGGKVITMAVACYAGNTSADETFLKQIRYNLVGENAITANGGYPTQHERHFTGAAAILKHTPRLWNQLTDTEREKLDLLMTAGMVGAAYTTSDANYGNKRQAVALDGDGNLHRDWNPNYREGMVGMMMVAAVYFGPDRAQRILDGYNHKAFCAKLAKARLNNPYETFTWKTSHPRSKAPTGRQIEKAVRGYRYHGADLSDPMEWYYRLTVYTYGKNVNAGLNGGKGIRGAGKIASGAKGLPNRGKPGMLREFDSNDHGGKRSSVGYAYDGFRPNLTNHIVLLTGGYWKAGAKANECLQRMDVGIKDLFYKLEHGYLNYAKGHAAKHVSDLSAPYHDFPLTRSLWYDVVRPYHLAQQGKKGTPRR